MVELQQFLAATLKQIVDGVKEAQESTRACGAEVNPYGVYLQVAGIANSVPALTYCHANSDCPAVQMVDFDVAVSTESVTQTGGGGRVKVVVVEAGGKRDTSVTTSLVSRVRFAVPVMLPTATARPDSEPLPPVSPNPRRNWV